MNTFKPTSHPAFSIRHRHLHVPRHQIAHEDLAAAQQRGTREALREAVGKKRRGSAAADPWAAENHPTCGEKTMEKTMENGW